MTFFIRNCKPTIVEAIKIITSCKFCILAKDFIPKRILVLKKITRFEFNKMTHKHLSETGLKTYLENTGSDYDGLLKRHKVHYEKVDKLLSSLEKYKADIKVINRFSYNKEEIDWADIVITAGGDGTFLLGASRINDDKPIVGVNTDPLRSEGYLCMPRNFSDDLQTAINYIFLGKFNWLLRQRISVTMNEFKHEPPIELHELQIQFPEHRFLEHVKEEEETVLSSTLHQKPIIELPYKALNEVFIGESLSARPSYYELAIDDSSSQKQKSSGVTVCTGTGSSSWYFHINHLSEDSVGNILELAQRNCSKVSALYDCTLVDPNLMKNICTDYNSSLCFSAEETRMAYTIRDPIQNKTFSIKHPRGFANKMTIKSRMWDAHVVIDGGMSYKFNDGAVVQLSINPRYALRCLNLNVH